MNAKHCKIIMLYGSPFDKLRVNGINQRFLKNKYKNNMDIKVNRLFGR